MECLNYTLIRQRIRKARIAAGLTQEALASMINLSSNNYLSRIETGDKKPSLELIARIASATQTDPGYIISGTDRANEVYMIEQISGLLKDLEPQVRESVYTLVELFVNLQSKNENDAED